MSPSVRVTDEQLLQALRELGATTSDTAVTTRKVAQHLDEKTSYVLDRLDQIVWKRRYYERRQPEVIGWRSNGGPNYWWAKEKQS